MTTHHRMWWFLAGAVCVGLFVVIDQLITQYVVASAVYLCNKGIALGVILPRAIFSIAWVGIVGLLGWLWWRGMLWKPIDHVAFMMIFAGACSNLVDRVRYGCVIDYIPFFTISSFNVADVFITCGAAIIAWHVFAVSRR